MSAANQVITQQNGIDGAIMEKVVLGNDLSSLTPIEKVKYINGVCQSLGLNPATNPIKLMVFQGKEIPYFRKEATEQLRTIKHVSIESLESRIMNGIYIVTANATVPDGRKDSATGATMIQNLQGDALCNAIMKAETKAKRRVTLSICGLGFNDESEMDFAKSNNANIHKQVTDHQKNHTQIIDHTSELEIKFVEFMADIHSQDHIDGLQSVFSRIKKVDFKEKPDLIKKLIDAKDRKKDELKKTEKINITTGEIQDETQSDLAGDR